MKYTKISTTTKKDIRKRYEYGESLKELAYEYCVNYGTLKNTASKESWLKGINAQIIYEEEVKREREESIEAIKEIKKHYKNLHKSNLAYMMQLEKNNDTPENKGKEEARRNRTATIREGYLLAKDLYGIMNPAEELEHKMRLVKFEQARQQLDVRETLTEDEDEFMG